VSGVRRVIVGGLISTALFVVPVNTSAADTTFSAKKQVVTLTLQVDVFAGKNVRTAPDGSPIDQYFKTVVEDTWGAAFTKFNSLDCYHLELKLDFELYDINDTGRDGSHKLYVGTEQRGWKGTGWDGAPKETTRNGDTGDGTRSFENNRKGDIPWNAPPTVVAHEFGHLLGLGDDRENGKPKNGRDGTVMVGGAEGVDVNVMQEIDIDLLDRIGEVLKHTKQGLPKCQGWNGPIKTTYFASGLGVTCTAEENGTVSLAVVDGEVSGTIEASGSETCTGPVSSITEPTAIVLRVIGTFEDRAFRLDVSEVIGDHALTPSCVTGVIEIPVEHGTGSAQLTFNSVPGYTTTCDIEVERRIADAAVG
jgi:hypothetical protein